VNLEDNPALDATEQAIGYTVFGRVKDGIQVLDRIGQLPTGASGPFPSDVPMPLVAVRSIARLDEAALAELPADNRSAALKERITAAAAAGDNAGALAWIERYRADCGAADAEIAVLEADAALKMNLRRRAVFVLEEYFASTPASDPTNSQAVALYRTAVPENQTSAAQLVGDCEPPAAPTIPDGASAAMDAMVAGQTAVREFVAAAEGHLECLAKIIDDEARASEQRSAAIAEHNRTVSAMEQSANDFNAQLRIFKARE
jgi:hypothetical protein